MRRYWREVNRCDRAKFFHKYWVLETPPVSRFGGVLLDNARLPLNNRRSVIHSKRMVLKVYLKA